MNRYILTACAAAALAVSASASEQYFVKQVVFPKGATEEQKVEMASRLIPSEKQLAWQDLELTAFLHFGMNTFTNREWGDGSEDPGQFNPKTLDTDQWVKALKDGGFKLVLLTAKHHDGFCLWPTATTGHSVASSPWLDGKGDVVKMLRNSCDKYGMKMGVYLSPWDRNAACYGSDAYNDMFVEQLTELLGNYGKIDEVWFDGACGEGPNGKKQVYDWNRFRTVIETMQPEAVMAIMGDDVRWVGNERGQGRETEWSATAITPGIYTYADSANKALGLFAKSPDLGGRNIVAKAERLYWWPSEVDVSIRPGWFYHSTESPRSLAELANIYLNSVGRNSVLLLNIPPDTDGLINDKDVKRLKELRNWIDANFSNNLMESLDETVVNCTIIEEDLSKGQRIEEFDIFADGVKVASGTTVGRKRIITFPAVKASKVTFVPSRFRGDGHFAKLTGVYNIEMPKETAEIDGDFEKVAPDNLKALTAGLTGYNNLANATDGDVNTSAVTGSNGRFAPLTVDMGQVKNVAGFTYMPDNNPGAGLVFKYALFVCDPTTGKWNKMPLSGEFSNIVNNPIEQVVFFEKPVNARYIMLQPLAEAEGGSTVSIAEFTPLVTR